MYCSAEAQHSSSNGACSRDAASGSAPAASKYGYIMSRHARTSQHARIWLECLRCIRLHDPRAPVVIIDDHSDPQLVPSDVDARVMAEDALTTIVRSKYGPGRAELLPYLYLHSDRPFEKAVVLHDSMFLQSPTADLIDSVADVAFLWDFGPRRHDWDAMRGLVLDTPLGHADELMALANDDCAWTGCFGTASVITWDFLDRIEKTYGMLSRLEPLVVSRRERCELERVFALCCIHARGGSLPPVLYGSIFKHPFCFVLSMDIYNILCTRALVMCDGSIVALNPQVTQVVKVWNTR